MPTCARPSKTRGSASSRFHEGFPLENFLFAIAFQLFVGYALALSVYQFGVQIGK